MAPPPDLTHTAMYTASEVEIRTGVPATTLRQWERRYGFPRPARSAGGYRMYSPQDLLEIRRMQSHLLQGVSARQAAALTLAGQDARPPDAGPPSPDTARLCAALTEALIASDLGSASALLAQAQDHLPQEEILLQVITPSLVEIGQRWERGEITVAHEHQASAFLRARLSALMEAADQEGGFGPLVVAACAPGEQHELGLMMLALALRRRGVRVAYLGANMPLGDLAVYARQRGAAALALALQGEWALEPTRAQRRDLADLGLPLFLGGALLNACPELAAELGGIYAGPDGPTAAQTVVRRLQALKATPPDSPHGP